MDRRSFVRNALPGLVGAIGVGAVLAHEQKVPVADVWSVKPDYLNTPEGIAKAVKEIIEQRYVQEIHLTCDEPIKYRRYIGLDNA